MNVLIVDDSALLRNILKQVITDKSGITIAGEATNGRQALELNRSLRPDLIIMDIDMPVMDGITATAEIMKDTPVPILILSSIMDSANGFKAMKNGAMDVMKKPDIDQFNNPVFYNEFLNKINTIAAASIRTKKLSGAPLPAAYRKAADTALIVMGASTGGPVTVCGILAKLPPDYPVGIALVQHLESGFDKSYAQWLSDETGLHVRLAVENDLPGPGEVIVAPSGSHLAVSGGKLTLENGPPILNQKPSVNRLFSTAAAWFRGRLAGVLLTGMGSDGADGCVDIIKHGGFTLVQDEYSSTIFGMPRAAIEKNGASHILSDTAIAEFLLKLAERP